MNKWRFPSQCWRKTCFKKSIFSHLCGQSKTSEHNSDYKWSSKKAKRKCWQRDPTQPRIKRINHPTKNLEAIFDSCLTFQSQNKTITQMGFFSQSTLLESESKLFDDEIIIHAFVSPIPDYCNAFLVIPSVLLKAFALFRMQNEAKSNCLFILHLFWRF